MYNSGKNIGQLHKVSICICTRNRPEELKKALISLEHSTYPVFEVIVSDDSTNDNSEKLVKSCFPKVKYLPGPRQGLGANRNNALNAATGSHILFLDDDALLGKNFLETVFNHLALYSEREGEEIQKVIVTGIEEKNGRLVFPSEQSFWGHQKVGYRKDDFIKTVVINSAVFPISLFKEVLFDRKLVYGYDEVDFTTRAFQKGFKITLCPDAVNLHCPSEIHRDDYGSYRDASRIYVTFKRYFSTEQKRLKALAYFGLVILHTTASNIKQKGIQGLFETSRTLHKLTPYITEFLTQTYGQSPVRIKV